MDTAKNLLVRLGALGLLMLAVSGCALTLRAEPTPSDLATAVAALGNAEPAPPIPSLATLTPMATPLPPPPTATATPVPIPPVAEKAIFSALVEPVAPDDYPLIPGTGVRVEPDPVFRFEDRIVPAYAHPEITVDSVFPDGTIQLFWQDNDALSEAAVWLDAEPLGTFPVALDRLTDSYFVTIGDDALPFTMEGLETRYLTVLAAGEDGAEVEIVLTLTRAVYSSRYGRLERLPTDLRDIELGFDPQTGMTGIVGLLPQYLADRPYLWDEVAIRIFGKETYTWRDHLAEPEKIVAALIDGERVSILFDGQVIAVGATHYTQFRSVDGYIIKGGRAVRPSSMDAAERAVQAMFRHRPEIIQGLGAVGASHAIFAINETLTDLPDFAHLVDAICGPENWESSCDDFDGVAQATLSPYAPGYLVSASSEESLIWGGNTLEHELSHLVEVYGFLSEGQLGAIGGWWDEALADGLFPSWRYGMSSPAEFWAECSASYITGVSSLGTDRDIESKLPDLYALLEETYGR